MSTVTYTPVINKRPKFPIVNVATGNIQLTAEDMIASVIYHPTAVTETATLPPTATILQSLNLEEGDAFSFILHNTGKGTSTLAPGDGFTTFTPGTAALAVIPAGTATTFCAVCTSRVPPGLTLEPFPSGSGPSAPPSVYDFLIVYMSTTGNDANDGLTPATAVLTMQRALLLVKSYGYNLGATVAVDAGTYLLDGNIYFNTPYRGDLLTSSLVTIVGVTGVLLSNVSVVTSNTDPNYQGMQRLTLQGGVTLPALPAGFSTYQGMWIQWKSGNTGTFPIAAATVGGTTIDITQFTHAANGTIDILYPLTVFNCSSVSQLNFIFNPWQLINFVGVQFTTASSARFNGGAVQFQNTIFTALTTTVVWSFFANRVIASSSLAGSSFTAPSVTNRSNVVFRANTPQSTCIAVSNSVMANVGIETAMCLMYLANSYITGGQFGVGTSPSSGARQYTTLLAANVVSVSSPGNGFYSLDQNNGAYFLNCTVTLATLAGFSFYSPTSLRNCIALSNLAEGVRAVGASVYIDGGTYKSNGATPGTANTNNGIAIRRGGLLQIVDNASVTNNTGAGISVEGHFYTYIPLGSGFSGITCSSNGTHGIQVFSGVAFIQSATCASNVLDGINLQKCTVTLSSCKCQSNQRDGVRMSSCDGVIDSFTAGTNNTNIGLNLNACSRILFNPTVAAPTGTAGAVKVGANAVTTWATVAGGLSANCSDYATASPAYCILTPTNYSSQ